MTEVLSPVAGTFRDPAGSVYFEHGCVRRSVRAPYAAAAEAFIHSPLAARWMKEKRISPTFLAARHVDGSLTLEHERVDFPSYPWEWSPWQWVAAGRLTLDLCEEALEAGLILKDATPLNVLFADPQPVFVDVLSFEPIEAGNPIWAAYGQFVRTFLLPLAANKLLGWPLSASMARRDGYEPADLYRHLSLAARWTSPLLSLVTMPYLLEGRAAARPPSPRRKLPVEVALAVLRRTFRSARQALEAFAPAARVSRWSHYTSTANHYSEGDHQQKAEFVQEALKKTQPRALLDIGANTGHYSRIAAKAGARVVAWDTDLEATGLNWQRAQAQGEAIMPLVADIARPTPSTGWCNSESLSLLDRSVGAFDAIMMLGVIHHLLLVDQIPLGKVFHLIRQLTTRWAIVEWVPASDSQFQQLCRGRQALYGSFDEEGFLAAAAVHFTPRMHARLANGRSLWLFDGACDASTA